MSATLHMMVGLPCSGKTTAAKKLELSENALRFTPDEWQIRIFGGRDVAGIGTDGFDEHNRRHDAIEHIMWDVAERVLSLGTSVILDFGFWSREERDMFRARASALGADFRIHYCDVPHDELFSRLERRNASGGADTFNIPAEMLAGFIKIFEPPQPDEKDVYLIV